MEAVLRVPYGPRSSLQTSRFALGSADQRIHNQHISSASPRIANPCRSSVHGTFLSNKVPMVKVIYKHMDCT